ncbi:MAG: serine/threonine protein kinase [Gemmataceae bacterium]|nr:serine/threonine protein kinase [Gemmataceae bacterium]MDW8243416.1 serine/threonine-protein kinase [Thermogemmata sp.]
MGSPPTSADEWRTLCPNCRVANESTRQPAEDARAVAVTPNNGPPQQLVPGQIIAGFEILEEINRGGMGVIYKARQLAMNRLVALKAINPAKLHQPSVRARFESEVKAAALLNHVNIVTVYQADLDGPFPYLAMEYVPGIDLLRLVRQQGPVPVLDAVYYIRQAAEGLQHAHERGLIHRDIKPSNLIVTPAPLGSAELKGRLPRVKILDMGLARVIAPDGTDSDAGISQPGVFLGTPDYVAPEQAEDAQQADIRSDIFSLGATFYYLLTGKVPFPGRTLVEKVRKALSGPPSPRTVRPEIPPAVDAVVRKMLAPDPRRRYQTPAELAAALDRILRGEKVQVDDTPEVFVRSPLLTEVSAHRGAVRALTFTPDGKNLISVGDDGVLTLWDPLTLTPQRTIQGDFGVVEQMAIAPTGRWAATCAIRLSPEEMGVQLWDLHNGQERRRLRGPADNVLAVAISPDATTIAAGTHDGFLWIWSIDPKGPQTYCLRGHEGPITGLCFVGPDSLLSTGQDGCLCQWELSTGKLKARKNPEAGPLRALAYARKRIALAGDRLLIRKSDNSILTLIGHTPPILNVVLSADGKILLSCGSDDTVRVWSTEEGTEAAAFPGHVCPVRALALAPDNTAAYTGDAVGKLRRWKMPTI